MAFRRSRGAGRRRSLARRRAGVGGSRRRTGNRSFGRRSRSHRANRPHRVMRGGIRF